MRCPYCGHDDDKVVDSRSSKDGAAVRRRRECLKCEKRFTTYEQVEELMPVVVKKDSRREPYDRSKVMGGLQVACRKLPVSQKVLEDVCDKIEKFVMDRSDKEVNSSEIGEMVIRLLHKVDEVAYIRFASVYREFKDRKAFINELSRFMKK